MATRPSARRTRSTGVHWEAMRAAHARIEPFEQADPPFEPDDVEWVAAEGVDRLNVVMHAIQDEHGTCRIAIEEAAENALALLTGVRAIALVLRKPLADHRAQMLLRDLAPDHAAERRGGIAWLGLAASIGAAGLINLPSRGVVTPSGAR